MLMPVQGHKVYVQQRLREAGEEVWQLLQQGAHFYVCGDAAYMAGDVERALLDIISSHEVRSWLSCRVAQAICSCLLCWVVMLMMEGRPCMPQGLT